MYEVNNAPRVKYRSCIETGKQGSYLRMSAAVVWQRSYCACEKSAHALTCLFSVYPPLAGQMCRNISLITLFSLIVSSLDLGTEAVFFCDQERFSTGSTCLTTRPPSCVDWWRAKTAEFCFPNLYFLFSLDICMLCALCFD